MRWIILLGLIVPFSFALEITEVMYNPGSELGGNYNEWVEVYSNEEIDLGNYKINGRNFDDIIINNEHLVIAENTDKFEEYFGNNNSVLDEGYRIVDSSSFSLDDNGDIVNLSNGINEIIINYSNIYGNGNGKSIEYFNGSWVESLEVKGTPGRERENTEGLIIRLEVIEDLPDIFSIEILPDESDQEGIQIFPEAGKDKEITVRVNASDYDSILIELDNEIANTSYEANFSFPYYKEPGNYSINISVFKNDLVNSQTVSFEYMELIAFDFFPNELNFNQVKKGKLSGEEYINLVNKGNTILDFSLESEGLFNGESMINSSYLEYGYDGNWSLFNEILDVNLGPDDFDEIQVRINVPNNINIGTYSGIINLFGIRG